jgi:hypothetical protein
LFQLAIWGDRQEIQNEATVGRDEDGLSILVCYVEAELDFAIGFECLIPALVLQNHTGGAGGAQSAANSRSTDIRVGAYRS